MRKIIVENCKKDEKLSKYIFSKFPNLKKDMWYKALRNKDIKINDKRISKDIVIKNGDILVIYIDDAYLFNLPNKILYIYKDENILVAFKPQGILSNNEDKNKNKDEITFEDLVKKDFENAKICHRLDRNTSGLLLFSLNDNAYDEIIYGFNNAKIHKEYIAYVYNSKFEKTTDTLKMYLKKDSSTSFVKIFPEMVKNSQAIITKYSVIYTNDVKNYAILNIEIPTGKTHQIRAQMSYISHPIIGDSKYGKNEVNKLFKMKKQLLFAYKYSFSFKENSILHYLNDKIIQLDKNYYENKLGE